jgi:hypothetical protein
LVALPDERKGNNTALIPEVADLEPGASRMGSDPDSGQPGSYPGVLDV